MRVLNIVETILRLKEAEDSLKIARDESGNDEIYSMIDNVYLILRRSKARILRMNIEGELVEDWMPDEIP